MWIATARGLLSWSEAGGLRPIQDPLVADRQVASVAVDAGGRIWAAVPSVGLLRLDRVAPEGGERIDTWARLEPQGLEHAGTVRTVSPSASGAVLVGGDQGLAEVDAAGSVAVPIGEVTPGLVSALAEVGEELWLGRGGELHLYRRDGQRWSLAEVVPDTGLINDFAVDRLGSVWAATDGEGVAKISALSQAAQAADLPCPAQVFAIARAAEDEYLVGGDRCSWVSSGDGRSDLSLVVLDLDNFKQVNDAHGHRAGDRLLADVARRLLGFGRESDLLARYGGEEFVVLMPETSEPEAIRAAERLRAALARSPFGLLGGIEQTVTGSFGVSCLQGAGDDVEALFRRADAAVYLAKRTKNAVAVWEREPELTGSKLRTAGGLPDASPSWPRRSAPSPVRPRVAPARALPVLPAARDSAGCRRRR